MKNGRLPKIAMQGANQRTNAPYFGRQQGTYHESGLWVISETNDESGFGIYLECLGDDQYNTAVSMLAGLDEYGFSD